MSGSNALGAAAPDGRLSRENANLIPPLSGEGTPSAAGLGVGTRGRHEGLARAPADLHEAVADEARH